MTIEEVVEAFRLARLEAEEMLLRDDVPPADAVVEAAGYVSLPVMRSLSEAAIVQAEAALALTLPEDLRSLVAGLDLSSASVWDANLRPLKGNHIEGISDAFLASVVGLTAGLRQIGAADGLAFGTTQDGDYLVLRRDVAGTRVLACDHVHGAVMESCATDVRAFLVSSARAAAAYYRRFGRVSDDEDWAASVLEEAWMDGIDGGWLERTILSRPRPT